VILAADIIDVLVTIGVALTFAVFTAAIIVIRLTRGKDSTK